MADFAFSFADTKLGRFDRSFVSGVPLPGGLYFAFRPFCETLIAHYRTQEGTHICRTSDCFRAHARVTVCDILTEKQ